jgi:hypothetical protein
VRGMGEITQQEISVVILGLLMLAAILVSLR